ncbi:MAG: DUF1616 domain-containing protein [Thermoplasmatota archaeon]
MTRPRWLPRDADLGAAVAVMLLACVLVFALPSGNALRALVTLAVILVVPGYLLLVSLLPDARPGRESWWTGVFAFGLSPPLVGLLALGTTLVHGGFRPPVITLVVTGATVVLAAVAAVRRRRLT